MPPKRRRYAKNAELKNGSAKIKVELESPSETEQNPSVVYVDDPGCSRKVSEKEGTENSDLMPDDGKEKKPKSEIEVTTEPPNNWRTMLKNIEIMRSKKDAPVDTMGCERSMEEDVDPKTRRFQTLVSLMLSSQTKDEVTYSAMGRLKDKGLHVENIINMSESELGELIKPVGFWKRKALYIKKTTKILREEYQDDIPNTIDTLCSLPGVGPKMAYICMNVAWNQNAGIGVDTHVHRISNRMGWAGKKGTNSPEKTRKALEDWLPKDLWQDTNVLLVGFGQTICTPMRPKCSECLNDNICPKIGIEGKSKKKLKSV